MIIYYHWPLSVCRLHHGQTEAPIFDSLQGFVGSSNRRSVPSVRAKADKVTAATKLHRLTKRTKLMHLHNGITGSNDRPPRSQFID